MSTGVPRAPMMKVFFIASLLACLPLTARASAPARVTVCVIGDGQGDWAIVTTQPGAPAIYTIHLVKFP